MTQKTTDLEQYFLIEDERVRDCMKQLFENCRNLQRQIDVLEVEVSNLKAQVEQLHGA
jgi:regulator of replication initiation timing